MPMLAIFSRSFNSDAETFILSHAKKLKPNATALISYDDSIDGDINHPHFKLSRRTLPKVSRPNQWRQILHDYQLGSPVSLLHAHERKELESFLIENNVSALLAEFGHLGATILPPCEKAAIPLYVYFRGYDATAHLRSARWRHFYRNLLTRATGAFAVSNFLKDNLLEIGANAQNIHVNPSGADPDFFFTQKKTPGIFLAVGRLVEKKSPETTINAFHTVASHFPWSRLEIIGDGPLRKRCERLVRQLKLTDHVIFHGRLDRETIAEIMSRSHIFVQHSITAASGDAEGLPTSIIEAMASSLPVVSTRHSGIPEAVEHGETGFLVDEKDVAEMANAMCRLLSDADLANKMGLKARQKMEDKFSENKSHQLIRDVIGIKTSD